MRKSARGKNSFPQNAEATLKKQIIQDSYGFFSRQLNLRTKYIRRKASLLQGKTDSLCLSALKSSLCAAVRSLREAETCCGALEKACGVE